VDRPRTYSALQDKEIDNYKLKSRNENLEDDLKMAGETIKEREVTIAALRAQVKFLGKALETANRGDEDRNACLHALAGLLNARDEEEDAMPGRTRTAPVGGLGEECFPEQPSLLFWIDFQFSVLLLDRGGIC
jgi:hypothetical protein